MKKIYTYFKKIFLLALLTTCFHTTKAQVLNAGDIAFTGYICNATGTDAFSFVLLVNIPAGTQIFFTNNGFNGNTNALQVDQQTITWTAGSALVAGREIRISGTSLGAGGTAIVSGSNINAGTVTGTFLSLPTSGDQITAYRTSPSLAYIAAIHMNAYATPGNCGNTTAATWDPLCITYPNQNASQLPTGLTNGTNAVWITPEQDNAVFQNLTNLPLATPAQVRAAVNNVANWTSNSILPGNAGEVIIPSGYPFLASIFPLNLLSFTGSNNNSFIGLNWQTSFEENDRGYFDVEKSTDGINFTPITRVQAQGYSTINNKYNHKDYNPVNGANFYRLKIFEANGATKYSSIVKVLYGKNGKALQVTPNPANAELTVSTTANLFTTVTITDNMGRIVLTERLMSNNQKVDVQNLPVGQYTISLIGNKEKVSEKLLIIR
jgi:Secretion system C-terminal sorting domain